MENKEIDRKETSRVQMQKYRATHRRIDYAPIPEAMVIIDQLRHKNPSMSIVQLLDELVLAGYAKLSGK